LNTLEPLARCQLKCVSNVICILEMVTQKCICSLGNFLAHVLLEKRLTLANLQLYTKESQTQLSLNSENEKLIVAEG